MHKKLLVGTCTALCLLATAPAQTGKAVAPPPAFEVASIKPAPPLDPAKLMAGRMHFGMTVDAARVDIGNTSLADLIRIAYRVKPYQIAGPDWMSSQRFDVLAKMPEGLSKDLAPEMLQALLAERFKLAIHRENKEHPVYALVVGKNGPRLKEAEPEAPAPPTGSEAAPSKQPGMVVGLGDSQVRVDRNPDGKGASVAGGPFGNMKFSMGEGGAMRMEFARISMPALTDFLSRFSDRPVIDMTELKGNYQVSMDIAREDMINVMRASAASMGIPLPAGHGPEMAGSPADAASTPSGSSVLAALQQLGLKMEPRKMPVETIVIDHLEKMPTEN